MCSSLDEEAGSVECLDPIMFSRVTELGQLEVGEDEGEGKFHLLIKWIMNPLSL